MRNLLYLIVFILISNFSLAQTGTEFWFAPPNITDLHRPTEINEVYINITSLDQDATVHIWQPANLGGVDMTVTIPANTSQKIYLGANIADLETKPTSMVLNTGLLVESTEEITAYYEYDNRNNADVFALKGANSLGTNFYIPLHSYSGFPNHDYSTASFDDMAYTSFDIVATEDNTTIVVHPSSNVDVHGRQQFTINLDRGQTYSVGWTGANYTLPSLHPYGSSVTSDKPIAITIKDDSSHNPSGGCFDLMGDQIVPVGIVGYDYIVVQGALSKPTGGESFFVLATENNTDVYINGSATPVVNLVAGETYRHEIASANAIDKYTYVNANNPVYVTHVTGFGCEEGTALLPPLSCAGSNDISFVRSTTEGFFLTILVPAGAENDFTVNPSTVAINPADFEIVPGTDNYWKAARIAFNTSEIPQGVAYTISNATAKFAMGLINGGGSTGCRYGYFSEYMAEIVADAGNDSVICATSSVVLNGNVTGGATTGIWTSSGTGTFDDATNFNAEYTPSPIDIAAGNVTLTITSTGVCIPRSGDMVLTIDPAPTSEANIDQTVCGNNANVTLNGSVTIATGGLWSTTGDGSFNNASLLNAVYSPGATDISNGIVKLYLTTTGNGFCTEVKDSMMINITLAPTINAGVDQFTCSNNAEVTLNAVTNGIPTGGVWTGGSGSYNPGNGALNTLYAPSAPEIAAGTVSLTVTSTGSNTCVEVSDVILLTFTPSPVVDAGIDQTKCSNNEETLLNASVLGGASTGVWSNGLGTFFASNTDLGATYTPTSTEIANGSVTLTLTTTDHAANDCIAVSDQMVIDFTPKPTVDAGIDQTVCANNANVSLTGAVTVASGVEWSTVGTGNFSSSSALITNYIPSNTDKTAGSVKIYIKSTGNASCIEVLDSMMITITPAPTANAGLNQAVCANNAEITLNGSGTIANAWEWTGGTGSYNPGNNAINTIYSPTSAEILSGSITLSLNSTSQGTCTAVSDDIIINFTTAPTVSAGLDQVKCANNELTLLNGVISGGASAGIWTNGLGTFVVDNADLSASYTPTSTEIANGSVTLTLTSTDHISNGCSEVSDQMNISFTSAPTVDAGMDRVVCQNSASLILNGNVSIASGGSWSGGTGSFSGVNNLNAVYTPSSSEISAAIPLTLTLTTIGNGTCQSESDQIIIDFDPSPISEAGAPQVSCANNPTVILQGSVVNAGGGIWSGSAGSFSPSNADLLATFTPTPSDILNGGVNLTLTSTNNGLCNPENDIFNLTIVDAPIVNAGSSQTLCANNSTISLNGSVINASGGTWSGGLGSYGDANVLSTSYQPAQNELDNGFVTLYLTSTGNGTCNSVQDQVTFTFTQSPTIDAGMDQTVCANNSDVSLGGIVTISSGGQWSGGLGTYTLSPNDLNTVYHPTNAEILAQSVSLTLTSTGNGTCIGVTDIIDVFINPSPIVNAGSDVHVCYNNTSTNLNGNVTNASGGQWLGGNGTFVPDNTTLNATYTPTQAEIDAGQIKLYLESTGNASCNPVLDSLTMFIDPAPIVNAGIDQTLCANNAEVVLNASVSNATGGIWSVGLGIFTPNNSILNATYTPTAGDITTGYVDLTLSSTGNGTCNAVDDIVRINFTPAPTVDAGIDIEVCENNSQVNLEGIVTIASGGTWTGGTGAYTPNNLTLSTAYQPTPTEIANGSLILTLSSTGNGLCNLVTDQVEININPSPIVDAGEDQNVCVDNLVAELNGSVSGITNQGLWSSSGTGYFVPNPNSLNADYVCSSADSLAGTVSLTLSSTNNDVCNAVLDEIVINILPAGQSDAGDDQTVCANNSAVYLTGAVTGGATSGVWSTSGTGTFIPNENTLNATYIPSTSDTLNGSVDLTLTANSCNVATSTIVVTITPAPNVSAGPDQIVCVDDLNIQLDGNIFGGTSTGSWSTNGTGFFVPNNTTIDAIYHASASDSINGNLELVLSATNFGDCFQERDTVNIIIAPAGLASAGPDQVLCSNNSTILLDGQITGGASEGQWGTSGSGYFIPSVDSLNASYVASAADLSIGSVTLVLSATNSCNFAFDALEINFTESPTANAGPDASLCANSSDLSLSGSFTISNAAVWTTSGTGTFTPSDTEMNVVYLPSASDINNGGVDIYLTTTGNGDCLAETDTLNFEITPSPDVSTGPNQTVCSSASSTQLYGYISGGSNSGLWSSFGSGTFDDDTDLNTNYNFSPADLAAGQVKLVLSSTNNGNCIAENDTMYIYFGNSTFAYAGIDQTTCGDDLLINLSGIVTGGTSTGEWTSTGNGTFLPDNTSINASYICSSQDSTNGLVELILTTTNNGGCDAGVDSMNVFINPVPLIFAGTDIEVCKGIDSVAIGGSASNINSVLWTSNGSGSFAPNDTSLSAYYYPSAADTLIGSVILTLESVNSTYCNEVSNQVQITFSNPLNVNFSQSLACVNQSVSFNDDTEVFAGSIDSWYWEFGDGTNDNNQNPTHTFTGEANYDVSLTVTSSLGCSYSKSISVTVYASPSVAFSYTSDCYLQDVVFVDESTTDVGNINSWNWNFGDNNNSDLQNPNYLFTNSGNYIVSLTVQNSLGCQTNYQQTIEVFPKPISDFTYIFDCNLGLVSFTDVSTSSGYPISFWDWSFDDGNSSSIENPVNTFENSGNHTVTLISGSSDACQDTIVQQVYLQSITADFNFKSECLYDSLSFNNQSQTSGDTINQYTWIFQDGTSSSELNPNHLYGLSGTYDVILIAESNFGCKDSVSKSVEVYPIPIAGFDYYSEAYDIGEMIEFTDVSADVDEWQWYFGDGISSSIQNPQHIYNADGLFTITQVVSNLYNCVDTAETSISINPGLEILPPKLPSAFSPNNDGLNDIYFPRGGPFKSIDFRIYNAWGKEIYSSQAIGEGWDGTFTGENQPMGVYVWTISAITTDDKSYTKTGDVTLIR